MDKITNSYIFTKCAVARDRYNKIYSKSIQKNVIILLKFDHSRMQTGHAVNEDLNEDI